MLQQLYALLVAGSLLGTPLSAPGPNPAPPDANPPAATIQRRVEEVRVSFSVEDQSGSLKNLPADAFTLYNDAQAVSSFTSFREDSGLPLRIGLLVDRSESVRKQFVAEQQAAQRFLRAVLRPGVDSNFLLDFTHQLDFRRPLPGDLQTLTSEVTTLRPGGQTALYDAIYAAAHFELMSANESQLVRRVIILFSDGEDNYSLHQLKDALAATQARDISIYSITVRKGSWDRQGDAVLNWLAEATGGRAFALPNLKHLDRVFSEIQDELRTEYSVAFRPTSPSSCGYHKLRVQPHDPRLHVRARQGYYMCAR